MNDVVISGLGVVQGPSNTPEALFELLKSGQSALRIQPEFAAYGFSNPCLSYVSPAEQHELATPPVLQARHLSYAWHAATQAWQQAGLSQLNSTRAAVIVATNKLNLNEFDLQRCAPFYAEDGLFDLDAYLGVSSEQSLDFYAKHQDLAALLLAEHLGLQHIPLTPGDACAAGGIAIGTAFRRIRAGELDIALVGASESSASYTSLLGFSVIGALSAAENYQGTQVSRPFDQQRDGFVLGEGAAFLVLESAEHARRRQHQPLAKITGFAALLEACRMTASADDGSEYARCMQAALADAGLERQDIDHINAHGTSTPTNDAVEALAIKLLFGERSSSIPISANKSALGHSLAASGAIEALLSVLSLQQQCLLPTLNFQQPDSDTDGLRLITQAQNHSFKRVMSNSFGFGGENCSLILEAL